MKQIVFTKDGFTHLQNTYQKLLDNRPAAVKDLAKAREMGDLSENGYYKAARMKLSDIDRQIRHTKAILKQAIVKEKTASNTIDVGSQVTVLVNGSHRVFLLVGTYEASPSEGKISSSSPLGKQLLGKKKGDTLLLELAENKVEYTVIAVA